ncbi:ABC-three component system middle component 6 [Phyllobacterium zundukense]|uniref:Uncharacterized protein n=1 Tax=Phyllobacterium zundukense TaxID=1867719 RepID=A0ACD4CZP0_9HYPH|nr:ABC-three component system middle component 6 [Phyllobacterium zundukense]UXN59093.1 hypothetical protein N8E88_09475 [Phyllobacterium zundukense]
MTVGDYVEAEAQLDPDFPERLKAGFLEKYYARLKEGHKGDELFELMCAFAQRGLKRQADKTAGICGADLPVRNLRCVREMILPTKHIPQNEALIGVGATLLAHLSGPMTVSGLWERLRSERNVGTFERFVLASSLLYLIGTIDIKDGLIVRTVP